MPLRVLIVPDKFKGTLTAAAAAQAIAEGWRRVRPDDTLTLLPISDGGDGFGSVLAERLGAERRTVETVDAAHRPIQAHWWYDSYSRRALIESAAIVGLAQLPPGRFHPFELDTAGLGAALKAAQASPPRPAAPDVPPRLTPARAACSARWTGPSGRGTWASPSLPPPSATRGP